MSSVVIAGDTSGSVTLNAQAVSGTTVLTLPNTSGTIALSMTLLGTITPTAVNSVSLGSLTLTSYKSLYIVFNGIGGSGTGNLVLFVSSNNRQSGGGASFTAGSVACSGIAWLDLGTGAIGGGISENTVTTGASTFKIGGLTNVATSTTTLSFRYAGTDTFAAIGSIVIYGVA